MKPETNIETIDLESLPPYRSLMNDGWKQIASVTTGGKPYFYFKPGTYAGEGRKWITWNRVTNRWQKLIEQDR